MNITRATGSGAVALTVSGAAYYQKWQLLEIRVHLSAAGGAGNLTATIDAGAGSAYATVVLTQDMTSITDLVFTPDQPITLECADNLVIAWANSGSKTYGVEVVHRNIA